MFETENEETPEGCGRDIYGKLYIKNCFNCNGLYDDSEGYSGYDPRCRIKPSMENLKNFPFRTPQKCFEEGYWLRINWEQENKRIQCEITRRRQRT